MINQYLSIIKISVISVVAVVMMLLLPTVISGCKTFDPIWIEELPAECNMSLNAYKIYYQTEDKSGTVAITNACIKKLHRQYCAEEIFVDGKVDYNDPVKYRNFNECLKEVQ